MGNEGSILACDIHEAKLKLVEKEAHRLGISMIRTVVRDAAAQPPRDEAGSYDAVLCDVPCSGLGVLRRKPEIKLRLKEEDINRLPALQASILQNAGIYTKPGGRLLYCTCTVNPAENGQITENFLRTGGFEKICEKQIFTGESAGGPKGDGFYYCLMRKRMI